ncbi:MAG: M48 family metallopeptidase [Candidatus Moranbacteria bacterium]|nr:M48 family metallopeptidase [Candidatus Moranbacteria bacterium]
MPTDTSESIDVIERRTRRSRRIRIAVRYDGQVVLSVPSIFSLKRARAFLETKLAWVREMQQHQLARPRTLLAQGSSEEYRATKKQARQCIVERVEHFQKVYKVTYRQLSIRNQKTRFGSCSAKGALSFNYRLMFLPAHLRDYVVVHELCHLRELNHSRRFWSLVAQTMPEYRKLKQELQAFSRTDT